MINNFAYKKQQSTNRVNAIYGIPTGSAFLSVVRSSKWRLESLYPALLEGRSLPVSLVLFYYF